MTRRTEGRPRGSRDRTGPTMGSRLARGRSWTTTEAKEEVRTGRRNWRTSEGPWTSRGGQAQGRRSICPTAGRRWTVLRAGVSLACSASFVWPNTDLCSSALLQANLLLRERRRLRPTPVRSSPLRLVLLRDLHRPSQTRLLDTEPPRLRCLRCHPLSRLHPTTRATRPTRPTHPQLRTLEARSPPLLPGPPLRRKGDRSEQPHLLIRPSRRRRARLSRLLGLRRRPHHRDLRRLRPTPTRHTV